jgi:hypothetical protein
MPYTHIRRPYTESKMKAKLTVTIDEKLIPKAKQRARAGGVSLSQLIESALRKLTSETRAPFSERWRGRFKAADREDERYAALARKYL